MINSRVPSNLLVARFAVDISKQQNSLAAVQEQIASGKKVNRPSDAPAAAAHLTTMRETLSRLEQYNSNSQLAESQLALEEGAIAGTTDAVNRIRELALRAANGSLDVVSQQTIASEIGLILDEVYTQANSRDSFGNYLFSGSNIQNQPFRPGTPVSYSGSDDSAKMDIALGRTIQTGDSGSDVFMRIRNGNGDFQTQASAANAGTGTIDVGSVVNTTAFTGENYEISFVSPTALNIVNTDSGATVMAAQPFTAGEEINIDGMSLSISGIPQTGDTFTIAPSENQDVFTSISRLMDATASIPANGSESAQRDSDIIKGIRDLDNALDHLNGVRTRVGTRLTSIESSRDENTNVALQIERTKSDVEDVDIADAVTRLQTQANSLEILQASYTRIEGMSLFDFM